MAYDVIVWDLETVPDLQGYAKANNLVGRSNEEIRLVMGDDFARLIYHSIVCIGALVATKTDRGIRGSGSRRFAFRPAHGLREIFRGRLNRSSSNIPKSYQLLAGAKRRLADEYDAAQERGEIRTQRDNQAFSGVEKACGPEVVPPKELHEARIIRDAEVADPGIVRRANPRPRTSGPAPARGGTSAGPNASPLEVPMRAAPG